MTCEMCGAQGSTQASIVEGSTLNVCRSCARYGVARPRVYEQREIKRVEYELVPNFCDLIKQARQKSGLSQSQFAQNMGEKESTYQKWELGTLIPSIPVAMKLGRRLGLELVQQVQDDATVHVSSSESEEPTLGDMIKIKQRK